MPVANRLWCRSLQGPVIETRVTFGGSSAPPKLNPLSCDGIIDTDISGGLEATKRRGCQASPECNQTNSFTLELAWQAGSTVYGGAADHCRAS